MVLAQSVFAPLDTAERMAASVSGKHDERSWRRLGDGEGMRC